MKQEDIDEVCGKALLKSTIDVESEILADNNASPEDIDNEIPSTSATVKLEENSEEFVKRALRDLETTDQPGEREENIIPPLLDPKSRFCYICRLTYWTRDNLLRHQKRVHENVKPNVNSPNNQCTACDKTFKTKFNFQKHLVRIHSIAPSEFTNYDVEIDDEKNYCKTCDQKCITRKNYRFHLTKVHNIALPKLSKKNNRVTAGHPTSAKLAESTTTTTITTITTNLSQDFVANEHNRQYEEKSDKHCNICDRTYSDKYEYRKHLTRVHDMIDASTSSRFVSRDITPIIDDTKNYCTACIKWYTSRRSFRMHLARIHRIVLPKIFCTEFKHVNREALAVVDHVNNYCNACKRAYIDKHTYRKHLLRIHKVVLPKDEKPKKETKE